MRINVGYRPTAQRIEVRRAGSLESQVRNFISSLHFAQSLDRVLLKGGRIVWVGGNELTSKQHTASWLKQLEVRSPF